MNAPLFATGVIVATLFCGSAILFARQRTMWRFVQLLGAVFLAVVVLAHAAEAFHLLPGMGWGLPNSAGHYLDLISAVLGLMLSPSGYIAHALSRGQNSK
jgi:uncharacterized membrane protein